MWRLLLALVALATLGGALLALSSGPAEADATFTVNRAGDAGDGNLANAACDVSLSQTGSQCTLRAAIEEANDATGADTIRFDISGKTSMKTISPTCRR